MTTAHNWNSKNQKRWYYLAAHRHVNPWNSRVNNLVRIVAHAWKQNPISALQDGRYPQRNCLHKFWWQSVKGWWGGVKFCLVSKAVVIILQHSCTTMRVFDNNNTHILLAAPILLAITGTQRTRTVSNHFTMSNFPHKVANYLEARVS